MDGFEGNPPLSSPKTSAVPHPSLSGSRETNENEHRHEQKPMIKHFMCPTISAAFKASVPRKKILSERNEISSSFENLHHHKVSNLGPKTTSLHSGKLPVSESDDDQLNNFTVDSSYKPYDDPLANNLAPRPKYLRYNPNKRRGIVLGSKKSDDGIKKEGSVVSDVCDGDQEPLQQAQDSSNLQEKLNLKLDTEDDGNGSVEDDDEEIEEDLEDDDEMEEDVEQAWSLKGVLKLLLLLVVFFISGLVLSSTDNSMVTSDTYSMIQKNIFEAVLFETYGNASVNVDQLEYSQCGFLDLSEGNTDYDEDIVELLKLETSDIEQTSTEVEIAQIVAEGEVISPNEADDETILITEIVHGGEEQATTNLMAEGEATSLNEADEETILITEIVHGGKEEAETNLIAEGEVTSLTEVDDETIPITEIVHGDKEETFLTAEGGEVNRPNEADDEANYNAEEITEVAETKETELKNVEVQESEPNNKLIIGASVVSVLLVSLVIIYVSKKARRAPIDSADGEPLKGKIETSEVQTKEECSQVSAPNIELLGEIEVSSSLRSCVENKSKTDCYKDEASRAYSTALPDDSTTDDSPSYGSFTAEKKIIKNKVEKSGEEEVKKAELITPVKKAELITPVRRSSRIRGRGLMSP